MNRITVVIERSEENFSAYVRGIDGISATGYTMDEIKKSVASSIDDFVAGCIDLGCEVPDELSSDYEINFELDIQSFLTIYEGIFSKSGLEKLTGINQKQLWHYAKGLSKPRMEQRQKIETALHQLGRELISLSL